MLAHHLAIIYVGQDEFHGFKGGSLDGNFHTTGQTEVMYKIFRSGCAIRKMFDEQNMLYP